MRRAVLTVPYRVYLRGPVAAPDALYFCDAYDQIVRVNRRTMQIEWAVDASRLIVAQPLGEFVMLSGELGAGAIGAMEASTGCLRWRADDVGFWCVAGDTVLITPPGGNSVRVLSLEEGTLTGSFELPRGTTPLKHGSGVLIAGGGGLYDNVAISAIDCRDRSLLWTEDLKGVFRSLYRLGPWDQFEYQVVGGGLLVRVGEWLACFDLRMGALVWHTTVRFGSLPFFSHDHRLYRYCGGVLTCVDANTGGVLYQTEHPLNLRRGQTSAPVTVDRGLLAYAAGTGLRLFDLETGALRGEYRARAPVVCDQGVFVDGHYVLNMEFDVHVVEYREPKVH